MNPFFQVLPALTMTAMNANRKAIKANRKEKYVIGWKKLQEDTDIEPTINFISCDTRDFDVYMSNEYPKMEDFQMDQWKHFEKSFIDEDFVIGILNELKRATGGDGDWRHITTVDGHWLKYIIILFQIIALASVVLVDNFYFDMGIISLQVLALYWQIVNYGKNQRDDQ